MAPIGHIVASPFNFSTHWEAATMKTVALVRWGIAPRSAWPCQGPARLQIAGGRPAHGMPLGGCPFACRPGPPPLPPPPPPPPPPHSAASLAPLPAHHCCSGGKDSCYNMVLCQQYGHEVGCRGTVQCTPPSAPPLPHQFGCRSFHARPRPVLPCRSWRWPTCCPRHRRRTTWTATCTKRWGAPYLGAGDARAATMGGRGCTSSCTRAAGMLLDVLPAHSSLPSCLTTVASRRFTAPLTTLAGCRWGTK